MWMNDENIISERKNKLFYLPNTIFFYFSLIESLPQNLLSELPKFTEVFKNDLKKGNNSLTYHNITSFDV